MPQPVSTTSLYMQYLPEALQEGDFLNRFLLILEGIWEPLEQRQDHIEMYFDPQTCSASMLPWFAGWLDTEINPGWPEMLIRDVLSEAMQLHNWRGTIYGLTRTLELTTGMSPGSRNRRNHILSRSGSLSKLPVSSGQKFNG